MNIQDCWYKNKCSQECGESCIRYRCMESLFIKSCLPESQWNYKTLNCKEKDLESFKTLSNICRDIKSWVLNGNNLYIYSSICGNGKTSWSIRLMYNWFDCIWHRSGFECHGLFINVPKFLYDHKRNINQNVEGFEDLCNQLLNVELVIWDDLPSRTLTEYEHQILLQFIDYRIGAGKSNIYTGNCNKSGCIQRLGDRLTSRIFGCGQTIEFLEEDKRGINNG